MLKICKKFNIPKSIRTQNSLNRKKKKTKTEKRIILKIEVFFCLGNIKTEAMKIGKGTKKYC